jgi:Fungal Zn(2)-Cys(6) binuclear cluster domain
MHGIRHQDRDRTHPNDGTLTTWRTAQPTPRYRLFAPFNYSSSYAPLACLSLSLLLAQHDHCIAQKMDQFPNLIEGRDIDFIFRENPGWGKRKQYRSCDQCKSSHRACNAAAVDIHSLDQAGLPSGPSVACSACQKTNKVCTFQWIQGLSRNELPETLKKRFKPTPADTIKQKMSLAHVDDEVYSMANPTTKTWSSNPSDYAGMSVTDSLSSSSSGLPWPPVLGVDMANNPALYQTYLNSTLLHNPYQFLPPSTFHSPPMNIQDSRFGQNVDISNTQALHPAFPEGSSSDEFETHRQIAVYSSSQYWRGQSVQTSTDVSKKLPDAGNQLNQKNDEMADATTKKVITIGMVDIFKDIFEGTIFHWVNTTTVPYKIHKPDLDHGNWDKGFKSLATGGLIPRLARLDLRYQCLRDEPISLYDKRLAKQALKLAVMAFSSQWGWQSETSAAKPGSISFARLLHRSLWYEARQALDKAAHIDSFHVILAKMTMFLIIEPRDDDDDDDIEGGGGDETTHAAFSPPEEAEDQEQVSRSKPSQLESHGKTAVAQARQHSSPIFAEPSAETIAGTRHLLDAFEDLIDWKQRILDNTAISTDNFTIVIVPNPIGNNCITEEDVEDFFMIFWLAVEFDTIISPLIDKPLSITDEDCVPRLSGHKLPALTGRPEFTAGAEAGIKAAWNLINVSSSNVPFMPEHQTTAVERNYVQDAVPYNVLLWRRLSVLRTLMSKNTTPDYVEEVIDSCLQVINHWKTEFAGDVLFCVVNHSVLPFDIQIRYVFLCMTWSLGCLLVACCIEDLDAAFKSEKSRQLGRASTSLISELKKESCFAVSEMSKASCETVSVRSGTHEFVAGHGALLGEPWPVVLDLALTKSCETFLDWIARSNQPNPESTLYLWVRANTQEEDLAMRAKYCIDGLNQLGWKSKTSTISAVKLQSELDKTKKQPQLGLS